MSRKKRIGGRREVLPARVDPKTIESIRIRALLDGVSPSTFAASVLEADAAACPVDELTLARYRDAICQRGRATPVDLLIDQSEAGDAQRIRRKKSGSLNTASRAA